MLVEIDDARAGHAARRLRTANLLPNVLFDEVDGMLVVAVRDDPARKMRCRRSGTWRARVRRGLPRRAVAARVRARPRFPPLYATLRRALPVLSRIGVHGQIVAQNEMALYSTLFETHDQASLAAFLDATIGPLRLARPASAAPSSPPPC